MDFDSSAKFISSLAKFLQSLCNGYVEFDNGVEVIGHIYLNVDTGKKIDYVLNEKVCKTDENSVTFISNSFHAQPAEKPKPVEKPKPKAPTPIEQENDEIIVMDDSDQNYNDQQYSNDNVQLPSTQQPRPPHPRSHGASKRSYSQSFSSSNRPLKSSKFNSSSSSNPNGAHLPSANDSSFNVAGNITAATESDLSHLSQVFPESIDPSDPQSDIKPILDKDLHVIGVKQEYDPSADIHQGEGSTYDDPGDTSYYSQDQSYESGSEYYGSGHRNSNLKSDQAYLGDGGAAGGAGESQGFCQGFDPSQDVWKPGQGCPVPGCQAKLLRFNSHLLTHWKEKHQRMVGKYFCPVCRLATKRKSYLTKHCLLQHNLVIRPEDKMVLELNSTSRRRGKSFNKQQALWQPGMPCPVCLSVINHKRYDRHWHEQHERIVTKYLCPFCDAKFKRREKLVRHGMTKHGQALERGEMVEVQEVNCQFIDPTPLDLATVLGIVYDDE